MPWNRAKATGIQGKSGTQEARNSTANDCFPGFLVSKLVSSLILRFQRPHPGFQRADAIAFHLDRFNQAVDDCMQIMIARVGVANRQLSRSPAHKVEFGFVRQHNFGLTAGIGENQILGFLMA